MSLIETIESVLRKNNGSNVAVRKQGDDLYRVYRYVSGAQTEVLASVAGAGSFMTYMALTDEEDGQEVREDVEAKLSSKLGRTIRIIPIATFGQGFIVQSL